MNVGSSPSAPGLPNFLIIGAARAGTTAVHNYLRPHPDVFLASRKEIHFFDGRFDQGLDWYRSHFVGASAARAIGEATPTYLYSAEAPARMARTVPDARLVAILRNPVDRAYSHYWMNRWQGREKFSFGDAIAAEQRRPDSEEGKVRKFTYLAPGRYLRQLDRVGEHYRREDLLVLLFDDLRDRPDETYGSICRFLQIDDTFRPRELGRPVNAAIAFRSLAVRRVLRQLPPAVKPMAKPLAKLNQRRASYPPLDAATRRRLVDDFEADNQALSLWLGRDLSMWSR